MAAIHDLVRPTLEFLGARTPPAWVLSAVANLDTLLLDHASLELKAAQQAQKLIRSYGGRAGKGRFAPSESFRRQLVFKMSRLAREELRHFEQVVAQIETRGGVFTEISPARYAGALHDRARRTEPGALVDALIIGAVIEARSCERFFSLAECRDELGESLAKFYASLLRAEARHFENYLGLARSVGGSDITLRIDEFLALDTELISSPDRELRFLSGLPATEVSRR